MSDSPFTPVFSVPRLPDPVDALGKENATLGQLNARLDRVLGKLQTINAHTENALILLDLAGTRQETIRTWSTYGQIVILSFMVGFVVAKLIAPR